MIALRLHTFELRTSLAMRVLAWPTCSSTSKLIFSIIFNWNSHTTWQPILCVHVYKCYVFYGSSSVVQLPHYVSHYLSHVSVPLHMKHSIFTSLFTILCVCNLTYGGHFHSHLMKLYTVQRRPLEPKNKNWVCQRSKYEHPTAVEGWFKVITYLKPYRPTANLTVTMSGAYLGGCPQFGSEKIVLSFQVKKIR